WGPRLPAGDPEKLARILFCYDNPPGTEYISGSQDAIGIIFPGVLGIGRLVRVDWLRLDDGCEVFSRCRVEVGVMPHAACQSQWEHQQHTRRNNT
ncbi:MAG: hypothetical protein QF662_03915, partial [Phycisphaerae bacterium]|nr:hypothetical protein [Phycisphaerae bacterium]